MQKMKLSYEMYEMAGNLVVGRPNRRSVGLPVLAEGAPVDAVNVNQTFVVDGQLEMVRYELAGLSGSGASDHDWL